MACLERICNFAVYFGSYSYSQSTSIIFTAIYIGATSQGGSLVWLPGLTSWGDSLLWLPGWILDAAPRGWLLVVAPRMNPWCGSPGVTPWCGSSGYSWSRIPESPVFTGGLKLDVYSPLGKQDNPMYLLLGDRFLHWEAISHMFNSMSFIFRHSHSWNVLGVTLPPTYLWFMFEKCKES